MNRIKRSIISLILVIAMSIEAFINPAIIVMAEVQSRKESINAKNADWLSEVLHSGSGGIEINMEAGDIIGNVYSEGEVSYKGSENLNIAGRFTQPKSNVIGNITYAGERETKKIEAPEIIKEIMEKEYITERIENSLILENTEYKVEGFSYIKGSIESENTLIKGTGYLIADNDIKLNRLNISKEGELLIASKEGDIRISGAKLDINAIIYAPNGHVELTGKEIDLRGNIYAKSIKINGTILNIAPNQEMEEELKPVFVPMLRSVGNRKENRKITLELIEHEENEIIANGEIRWNFEKVIIATASNARGSINAGELEIREALKAEELEIREAIKAEELEIKEVLNTEELEIREASNAKAINIEEINTLNSNIEEILNVQENTENIQEIRVETTDVRIDESTSNDKIKNLLFKEAGKYIVKVTIIHKGKEYITEEVINIEEDIKPKAEFYIVNQNVMRNENEGNIASIPLIEVPYSSDGDEIAGYKWFVYYDSNNDGDFKDEKYVSYTEGKFIGEEPENIEYLGGSINENRPEAVEISNIRDIATASNAENTRNAGNTTNIGNTENTSNTENTRNVKNTTDTRNIENTTNTGDTENTSNTTNTRNTESKLDTNDTENEETNTNNNTEENEETTENTETTGNTETAQESDINVQKGFELVKESETVVLKTNQVGKYHVELIVQEFFEDTIEELLEDNDYLRGNSSEKSNASKEAVVGNRGPEAELEIEKAKKVTLLLAIGNADSEDVNEYNKMLEDTKEKLEKAGVEVEYTSVETTALTAKDEFAWEEYDHYNYADRYLPTLPKHIIYEGNNIKMIGYSVAALNDFLYIADESPSQKILSFDLQRDTTNWHSMEGGGFLFNTHIDKETNTIEGYAVIITEVGLKLVRINKTNLDTFRNHTANHLETFGRRLATFHIGNVYAKHNFRILIDENKIWLWDTVDNTENLVINGYELKDEIISYGYGPVVSHASHGCSQQSYFTFENIRMETISGKSLTKVLEETEWKVDNANYVIYVNRGNTGIIGENIYNAENIKIIQEKEVELLTVGSKGYTEQMRSLIKATKGQHTNYTDRNENLNTIQNYILNREYAKDYHVEYHLLKEQSINHKLDYKDIENDPLGEAYWEYHYNKDTFNANEETEIITTNTPLERFDNSGAYGIKYKVKDKASEDFLDYDKWSEETIFQKNILVHNRPIAKFEISTYKIEETDKKVYINITDESYDNDHIGKEEKGIISKEYSWLEIENTENQGFITGLPISLEIGKTYLIRQIVTDKENTKSAPYIKVVSTKELEAEKIEEDKIKPVIYLEIDKQRINVGETAEIIGYARDNIGVAEFKLYVNGEEVLNNPGRFFYHGYKEEIVRILAKAKDIAGNITEEEYIIIVEEVTNTSMSTASIISPETNTTLTENTDIIGTAIDADGVRSYNLTYKEKGSQTEYLIATGTKSKYQEILGTLPVERLPLGTYQINLYVTDIAGNTAVTSVEYNINGIKKEEKVIPSLNLSKETANIGEDITAKIGLIGAEYTEKIEVYVENELVLENQIGEVIFSSSQAGIITVTVKVYEKNGNVITIKKSSRFIDDKIIDQTYPEIRISNIVLDNITEKIEIIGTAKDETALEKYTLSYRKKDKETYIKLLEEKTEKNNEQLGILEGESLSEGRYEIKLEAYDKAGNYSEVIREFELVRQIDTRDNISPSVEIRVSRTTPLVGEEVKINFKVEDNVEVRTYTVKINEIYQTIENDELIYTPEIEGRYKIDVTAIDTTGNISNYTYEFIAITREEEIGGNPGENQGGNPEENQNREIDQTPPEVEIISPTTNDRLGNTVQIIGTVKDEKELEYYEISYKKKKSKTNILIERGENQKVNDILGIWNTNYLEEGIYEITLMAKDKAGNKVWVTREVKIGENKEKELIISTSHETARTGEIVNLEIKDPEEEFREIKVYQNNILLGIGEGKYNITSNQAGNVKIKIEASTYKEETIIKEINISFYKGTENIDTQIPTVIISSPAHDSQINGKTKIIGTATDESGAITYKLEYKAFGTETYNKIQEGNTIKNEEVIGILDTINLTDGWYYIKLTAKDNTGNSAMTEICYQVNQKGIGNIADTEVPRIIIEPESEYATVGKEHKVKIIITDNIEIAEQKIKVDGEEVVLEGEYLILKAEEACYKEIEVWAKDTKGNINQVSARIPFTLEEVEAEGTLVYPEQGSVITAPITVRGEIIKEGGFVAKSYKLEYKEKEARNYTTMSEGEINTTLQTNISQEITTVQEQTNELQEVTKTTQEVTKTIEITAPQQEINIQEQTAIQQELNMLQQTAISKAVQEQVSQAQAPDIALLNEPTNTIQDICTFDPTLLLNGVYDIKLTLENAGGDIVSQTSTVHIEGEMKIGHTAVSFTDAREVTKGSTLTLTRNYNSMYRKNGDFGYGWSMGITDMKVIETVPLTKEFRQIRTGSILSTRYYIEETKPHEIVVIYGDGNSDRFVLKLEKTSQPLIPFMKVGVRFECETSENTTLEIIGENKMDFFGLEGVYNHILDETYNPVDFILTKNNNKYYINKYTGLRQIEDAKGNIITVSRNGYTLQDGTGIILKRDENGRVYELENMIGEITTYTYDEKGDLIKVTSPNGKTIEYTYDNHHKLLSIIGPDGIEAARSEYNEEGRLIATIDGNGNKITYDHNIEEQVEVVKDGNDNPTTYYYDNRGNILKVIDANGNETNYTYDNSDNKTTVTDALGNTTKYEYDEKELLKKVTAPDGLSIENEYNEMGLVITSKYLDEVHVNMTYDNKGNITGGTDANGNSINYAYDENSQLISQSDSIGTYRSLTYDEKGQIKTMTDENGTVSNFTYDEKGNIITKTVTSSDQNKRFTENYIYDEENQMVKAIRNGNGNPNEENQNTTTYEYDINGNKTAKIGSNGDRTLYSYDRNSNLLQITYSDTTTETYTYDKANRLTKSVNRNGTAVTYTYDSYGNLLTKTLGGKYKISYTYDARNQVSSITGTNGGITRYEYNETGLNTSITDPFGNTTKFEYNDKNQLSKTIDANESTYTYEYDNNANLVKTTYPDGVNTQNSYDARNRLISTKDGYGNETRYTYNNANNLTSVTNHEGSTWNYEYDWQSNPTKIIAPNTNTTTYTYNDINQLLTKKDTQGNTWNYTYDIHGRLIKDKTPTGKETEYTYDSQNRVKEISGQTDNITYNYKPDGSIDKVNKNNKITRYNYNEIGELISRTDENGRNINYTYDRAGNIASIKTPYAVTRYEYDIMSRLVKVTDSENITTLYAYDKVGNLKLKVTTTDTVTANVIDASTINTDITNSNTDTINTANTVDINTINGIKTTYTYDNCNRLIEMKTISQDGRNLAKYEYEIGRNGERLSIRETGEIGNRYIEYTYDNLNRLIKEQIRTDTFKTITYTYDNVGNRRSKTTIDGTGTKTITYRHNELNQLIEEQTAGIRTSYTYDNDGALIYVTSNTETRQFLYDWQGNFSKAIITSEGSTITETYEYDANGMRTNKSTEISSINSETNTTNVTNSTNTSNSINYLNNDGGLLTSVLAESR